MNAMKTLAVEKGKRYFITERRWSWSECVGHVRREMLVTHVEHRKDGRIRFDYRVMRDGQECREHGSFEYDPSDVALNGCWAEPMKPLKWVAKVEKVL